jgi:hypothetical protein
MMLSDIKLEQLLNHLNSCESSFIEAVRLHCRRVLIDRGWMVRADELDEGIEFITDELMDEEDNEAELELVEYYDNHEELGEPEDMEGM